MNNKYKNPKTGKKTQTPPFASAMIREVLDEGRKRIFVPTDETVEECVDWVKKKQS